MILAFRTHWFEKKPALDWNGLVSYWMWKPIGKLPKTGFLCSAAPESAVQIISLPTDEERAIGLEGLDILKEVSYVNL